MTRGQDYVQRMHFINDVVGGLLSVTKDFDYIKYARQNITNGEYIRMGDVKGSAITMDITGKSLEEIVNDIARIILTGAERITPPSGIITDMDELRTLAPLFK